MTPTVSTSQIRAIIDDLYRSHSRRIFATLIRLLGDFDSAEEALQDAFAAALQQWSRDGIPANPQAWLVSTGRFKAIDALRRRARFDKTIEEHGDLLTKESSLDEEFDERTFNDDHLRLIFTCCHPALPPNTQIALTLRETCGLTTEEIASAFLTSPVTIAQRIVRGKAKIRDEQIPYAVPTLDELPDRLDSVLSVIYLVFNEGYYASSGNDALRPDLSNEAIYLTRVLLALMPDPEVMGLLALMLLHESRRSARVDSVGDLILLEDQNRALWNQEQINEGMALVDQAFATRDIGVYSIQAAISAVHARSGTSGETDWGRIVGLYDLLLQAQPSPIVELNRAVALAMQNGPEVGLNLIDALLARGEISEYHLAHAAKADLLRRLARDSDARRAYETALSFAKQEPERRFLSKRLQELG